MAFTANKDKIMLLEKIKRFLENENSNINVLNYKENIKDIEKFIQESIDYFIKNNQIDTGSKYYKLLVKLHNYLAILMFQYDCKLTPTIEKFVKFFDRHDDELGRKVFFNLINKYNIAKINNDIYLQYLNDIYKDDIAESGTKN